jgi:hypothetical protein
MSLPKKPSPEDVLDDLKWFLPELYRGFEHGLFKAKSHFETEDINKDGAAFSMLVRLHAREYLRKKGLEAVEIKKVNLCGLALDLPGYKIKIWKAADDAIPIPGHSEPKQEFYQQSLFEQEGPLKLIIIWNLNSQSMLSAVWLICPKSGDETSAEAHWNVKVPDPSLAVAPAETPAVTRDLPIERKPQADTGTKKV